MSIEGKFLFLYFLERATFKMYYKLRAQLLNPIMKEGVGVLIWD